MVLTTEKVCLGPYSPKQKLYLETEDGLAMEGQFFKFNLSKTAILLHQVELVPPDGRVFDQYEACLCDLVCLRSLEAAKGPVEQVTNVVRTCDEASGSSEHANSSSSSTEDQSSAPKVLSRRDQVSEALRKFAAMNSPSPSPAEKKIVSNGNCERNGSRTNVEANRRPNRQKPDKAAHTVDSKETINIVCTDPLYEEVKKKAMTRIVIDKLGPEFQEAVEDMEQQSIIGLGSHGAEQGRKNRLSYLTVVTGSSVYLIDVEALGKHAWQSGLRKIIESAAIEKVVYDCRLLSDCLLHCHSIKLENVFDVQAADCVINRCRAGKFNGRGRSLQELVSQYLQLPATLLTNTVKITNYKVWYQRPLPTGCWDYAAWQIVFLPQLRSAMDKAYRYPLLNSFNVYLDSVRPFKGADAFEAQSRTRQLPIDRLELAFTREN